MNKRIIFVVNVDWFFISHRLPLALEAKRRNWEVYLIANNTGKFEELQKKGIICIDLKFDRAGKNPFKQIGFIFRLRAIYNHILPNIIHHITLKPSIYGTIASKKIKSNPKVINAVSGLGYTFTDNRKSISKFIVNQLLKFAFRNKSSNFIFQNPDDKKLFNDFEFLNTQNNIIIKGSGVDELEFSYSEPLKKEFVCITFLGRILKDKGIVEFIRAANILRPRYEKSVKFLIIGNVDLDNPSFISKEELESNCDGDFIIWHGFESNVKQIYSESHIVCLPSYREGLPKSLVEAMAIGRPIITTNVVGCRECVDDGVNGFLVPVKSINELANRLEILINDEALRLNMGKKSREKMINEMSLSNVIKETFKFYE